MLCASDFVLKNESMRKQYAAKKNTVAAYQIKEERTKFDFILRKYIKTSKGPK